MICGDYYMSFSLDQLYCNFVDCTQLFHNFTNLTLRKNQFGFSKRFMYTFEGKVKTLTTYIDLEVFKGYCKV